MAEADWLLASKALISESCEHRHQAKAAFTCGQLASLDLLVSYFLLSADTKLTGPRQSLLDLSIALHYRLPFHLRGPEGEPSDHYLGGGSRGVRKPCPSHGHGHGTAAKSIQIPWRRRRHRSRS